MSRSESLVDLRDKLKSVPTDVATVTISNNKMKIQVADNVEAKSKFQKYLEANGIKISKYHKNIENVMKWQKDLVKPIVKLQPLGVMKG